MSNTEGLVVRLRRTHMLRARVSEETRVRVNELAKKLDATPAEILRIALRRLFAEESLPKDKETSLPA